MRSLLLTLLLVIPLVKPAFACAPGEWLQQGAGWQMCVPIPGASQNNGGQSPPKPQWEDRWGAIAVDDTQNGVGIGSASGMRQKRQAERTALAACKNKGGTNCKVELAYYSQCAALVWGDHGFNVTGSASIEKAAQLGMQKCAEAKDTNCEVYFSDCSYPEQVR